MEIVPSILASNFSLLREELKKIEKTDIQSVHFDVMDNHFVSNLTFGHQFIKDFRSCTTLKFQVHLMIERPEKSIDYYLDIGIDLFIFHVESTDAMFELIRKIKGRNVRFGIAINPKTSVPEIEKYLEYLDVVLVMLVEPGFCGREILWDVLPKIERLNYLKEKNNYNFSIQVDGGINLENIYKLKNFKIDSLVIGSAFFRESDYAEFVKKVNNSWIL